MSTRATYHIAAHGFHPGVTFYIHSDGYPTGAYEYFKAASQAGDASCNSSFAERFIRANDTAEFSAGHEAHGDTEYRYTYTPRITETLRQRDPEFHGILRVESAYDYSREAGTSKFKTIWEGPLNEFLAKEGEVE